MTGREGTEVPSRARRVPRARIVLAGAPSPLRDGVSQSLVEVAAQVTTIDDLRAVDGAASDRDVDVVVLVGERRDGLVESCAHLRARFHNPLVVVAPDAGVDSTVEVLDAGADDLVSAPVSSAELTARILVALRFRDALTAIATDDIADVGGLRVDLVRQAILLDGVPIGLPPNEFTLITALARRQGEVSSADELCAIVWPGETGTQNRLRICITRLRKLLAPHRDAPRIVTVRGLGYSIVLGSGR